MMWDDVKDLLIGIFGQAPWIAALECSDDSKRLGACIAMDVLSEALEAKVFEDIFEEIGDCSGNIESKFGEIINDEVRCVEFLCRSRFNEGALPPGDRYVRTLTLDDYIEFYALDGYNLSPGGRLRIIDKYRLYQDEGIELRGVRSAWQGRLPNVWVTSDKELDDLLKDGPKQQKGQRAYDALGLSWNWNRGKPELIAVKYPEQFGGACAQPTTLDAWWKEEGHYYLSHGKEDNWGRTISLTGDHPPQKERVHLRLEKLAPGYRLYYIGEVERPIYRSEDLLQVAYKRLEAVRSTGAGNS